MPIRILRLDGGLVTSRDASLIGEGELTVADDCYYEPNNPAILKVNGRTAFNGSPESGAIVGARYAEFEGADDKIIIHVGTTYREATAATTGSFTNLVTGLTGGTHLDSVHYNNEHFLLNGVDRNRVRPASGTVRYNGMLPNTAPPTYSLGGTGITLTSNSTLTYWVEERVKSSAVILRRNSASAETSLVVPGPITDKAITITRPAIVNSEATHWALFSTTTGGSFPLGAEIAEVAIATTSITDTRSGTDPLLPTGTAYDTVSATVSGISAVVPKWGAVPIASTGDIFEDSLVLDDSLDHSIVRYSYSDEPDAFPSFNYIRFETKEADEIKCIRALGRSILVLMRDSVWRIDTLPRPEDSAFQIERVKEQIHGAQGCVGPMAATIFSFGQGIRLAYVSRYGILVTDGYDWDVLTDDIDWSGTVSIPYLSNCRLINNPVLYRLELDYTPVGETANTKTLFLHYHPSHAKSSLGGGFRSKVTGPVNRAARSSCVANVSGEHLIFTGHANGTLYLESSGTADTSGAGGISMRAMTGDVYASGLGEQFRLDRTLIHHQAGVPGQTITAQAIFHNEGEPDRTELQIVSLDRREATSTQNLIGLGEAVQIEITNTDSLGQVALDFVALDVSRYGPQKQRGG